MAGPWERYQQADGPWAKYAQPEQQPEPEGKEPSSAQSLLRVATPAATLVALTSKGGRQDLANAMAGGLRGAGSIGATLVRVALIRARPRIRRES
jgi:hypothetical protein